MYRSLCHLCGHPVYCFQLTVLSPCTLPSDTSWRTPSRTGTLQTPPPNLSCSPGWGCSVRGTWKHSSSRTSSPNSPSASRSLSSTPTCNIWVGGIISVHSVNPLTVLMRQLSLFTENLVKIQISTIAIILLCHICIFLTQAKIAGWVMFHQFSDFDRFAQQ